MFLLVYHLLPLESHAEYGRVGDAMANCWIERETLDEADVAARAMIESESWRIVEREEAESITHGDYEENDPDLEYFEQALTDGEVIVFHVSPRYPVYWVTASVEQEAIAGASEAHLFVSGDSILREDEDVFDPEFWTGERKQACLDSAHEFIQESGWNVVSITADRPCGRGDVPEELLFAYDEAEEEGSCLVFEHENEEDGNG